MTASAMDTFRNRPGFRQCGKDEYEVQCPGHEDRKASLSIGTGNDGRILLHCHAGCSLDHILEAAGLEKKDLFPGNGNGNGNGHKPESRIEATYDYRDLGNNLFKQVVRFEFKDFRQRRPDGNGGWNWSVKGLKPVPYRLPELQTAEDVFIVEGEKDVESVRKIGLTATCIAGGANSPDWPAVSQYCRADQRFTIIPDKDEPGETYAKNAATALFGKVASVKILRLEGLPDKGDVSDWLIGRDPEAAAEELCRLADAAPEWKPEEKSEQEPPIGFLRAVDIMTESRPAEIISGIAWAGCLTSFTSESGTGKTFTLLSMAAAVSDGNHWLARPVTSGSVAYASYEADSLGVRLRALREVQKHSLDHVYILRASLPLSPIFDRDKLEIPSPGENALSAALINLRESLSASSMPPIRLLIIDTIRASLAGSEDSSDVVSAYLRSVRRIASNIPDAGVILAHHSGWQDGENKRKRERGSSAFRGNIDGTVYLELDHYNEETREARLILKANKVRDDELPPLMYLMRKAVTLTSTPAEVNTGRPVTSCIIERDSTTPQDREAAAAEEHRALDLSVLRIISEHPELSTSQDRIRIAAGLQRDIVCGAIARLIGLKWIVPPARQRQPYTLTPDGETALKVSRPESSWRVVPSELSRPPPMGGLTH